MTHSNRRVHVVDSDEKYRASIIGLLKTVQLAAVESESAEDILERFDPEYETCVLSEIRLPGMSGLALLKQLKTQEMAPPVIITTSHADVATAVEAMKHGALEFFQKPVEPQKLIDAIHSAFERASRTHQLGKRRELFKEMLDRLTPREREVLDALVRGQSNRVIAKSLGIRERTVEAHRSGIMRKLDAHSIVDVVRCAFAAGIDDPASDVKTFQLKSDSSYNSRTVIRSFA
jgi:RNA polymerase sigma factor (sigma-70 family)